MKTKRILALLLAVVMVLSMIPAALAAEGDTYVVEVQYVYSGTGTQAAQSWTGSYAHGSAHSREITVPSVVGYNATLSTVPQGVTATLANGKLNFSFENLTGPKTIKVVFEPADVNFTVEYYKQNAENDDYTKVHTEVMTGKTNVPISNYIKYENAQVVVTGGQLPNEVDTTGSYPLWFDSTAAIAADGSTVVKVYFDRDSYLLTFDLGGGYGVEPQFLRYGAAVAAVGTPTRPGYTFAGWYTDAAWTTAATVPATMPAEDVKLYAKWTERTDVPYTVVFWYENANDTNYSYAGSITQTGTTGASVSSGTFQNTDFTGRDADHFTYNASKAETQTIAGDGSTVLNVYFTRNVYTLTFVSSNGNTTYGTITAKYQADIADKWPTAGTTMSGSNNSVPTNLYYWNFRANGATQNTSQATKIFTMTANICSSDGKTFTANTSNNTSTYTINYYLEALDGSGDAVYQNTQYDRSDAYSQDLKYSKNQNSWGYKEIDGFYPAEEDESASISNGAFNLYYNRNRNSITFYNGYGTTVATVNEVMFEMPLSNVTYNNGAIKDIVPAYPSGALEEGAYVFGGWYTTADCLPGTEADFTNGTMPNANLAFYAKWVPVTHDVDVYLDNTLTTQIGETQKVPHNDVAEEPENVTNGSLAFVGWFYMDNGVEKAFDFESMQIKKNMVIYGKWKATNPVAYTVLFELADGTPVAAPINGMALPFTTVTHDAKFGTELYADYQTGYYPDSSSKSLTMTVDSVNNVVTFIYKPVDKVPYTVRYLLAGADPDTTVTTEILHADKEVSDNTKSVVTENAEIISGYLADAVQKRLILTAEGENVLIFWYTPDTEHAYITEVHYTTSDGVTGEYYRNSETGDIGTSYSKTDMDISNYVLDKVEVDGVTYDKIYVNDELWTGTGDPTAELTSAGLTFEFYYIPNEFYVHHSSNGAVTTYTVTPTHDLTNDVTSGYLYSGHCSDATYTTFLTESGLAVTPEAGDHYYVKEVSDSYLQPRIFFWYDTRDNNRVKQIYLITAIDSQNYLNVGFDLNSTEAGKVAPTDDTVYEEIDVMQYQCPWPYEEAPVRIQTLYPTSFYPGLNGYLHVYKYAAPVEPNDGFTFKPFWVTPDGVKVTGIESRTYTTGEGPYYNELKFTSSTSSSERSEYEEQTTTGNTGYIKLATPLSVRKTYSLLVDDETPEVTEFTVTKVDGSATTTQTVPAGDNTGAITYAGQKGKVFAGWFTDRACTKPADFSDVSADMTVYAKYVNKSGVSTSVSGKPGSLTTTVTLPTDALAEVGFTYSYQGTTGTVVTTRKTSSYSFFSRLTGSSVSYKYSADWKLPGLSNWKSFTVTPYWVTLDGTVVYGDTTTHMSLFGRVY